MKIVFMGTPDFAVPSLKSLIDKFEVVAVLTQPDRPKGRGNKVTMSPVKEVAIQHNIPVYQPIRLKNEQECIDTLKELRPDFIIVVAFGQILPKEVLDIPRYGCINLHASLLPKYRGAAPLNWAILNGEKVSGNTTMLMDVGLDTGDILLQEEVKISEEMTKGELHDILMMEGAKLLVETIELRALGKIESIKQIEEESSYSPMLTKELGQVNWTLSNTEIHNKIKGLNPSPLAYTKYRDQIMKIVKVKKGVPAKKGVPGAILEVSKVGIEVATGSGTILIEEMQFPGKKPMKVSEFIKGNTMEIGVVFQ